MAEEVDKLLALKAFYLGRKLLTKPQKIEVALEMTDVGVIAQSGVWLLNQAATRSTSVTSTPSLNFTPVITLVK